MFGAGKIWVKRKQDRRGEGTFGKDFLPNCPKPDMMKKIIQRKRRKKR